MQTQKIQQRRRRWGEIYMSDMAKVYPHDQTQNKSAEQNKILKYAGYITGVVGTVGLCGWFYYLV